MLVRYADAPLERTGPRAAIGSQPARPLNAFKTLGCFIYDAIDPRSEPPKPPYRPANFCGSGGRPFSIQLR